jgi:uncharacterized membrane protein YidH (DUF202 family)
MTFPGQSRERTAISWGRTALGTAGLGALLVRLGVEHDSAAEVCGGVVALLAAGGFAWCGRTSQERASSSLVALRVLTVAVVASGVLAGIGVLTSS